jgi:hypothetical protein
LAFTRFSDAFGGKHQPSDWGRNYGSGGHHYDPNQPRVPAGHPDGGQWTDAGGSEIASRDDGRVLSDATPHNDWLPWAQYAGRIPRGSRRGPPATPAQEARLAAAEVRERNAVRAVQEREPNWEPRPGIYNTVEGEIAHREARALEAEARLQVLIRHGIGPGPFARESISSRGPSRSLTEQERQELNRIGSKWGCHTCGTKNPGTESGNWYGDHQHPNAMSRFFRGEQRRFPHCRDCSNRQGGWLANWLRQLIGHAK